MGDRRTEVNHPASGITSFTYDPLGNVLTKQTANMAEEGKMITYTYDYHRLTGISYPDHPENNVKYYYGGRNASHNRIGRLMMREDGTGAIEYFYGKMGEVTKTRRTLIVPNQAIATYVTQWTYDSHNRLLEMIYPDEEKVTYSYNLGGLLEKVRGEKSYGYDYITKLGYDKFEQRSYLKYCNGAETFYTYDNRRRLSNLAVNSGNTAIMDNDYTFDAVRYVNGVFSGVSTNTAKFSLYVSPYLVANQGGRYTKHIYAGSQRIVSKIGDFASYGSDPRRIEYAGANTDGLSVDYKAKYAAQQQVIKDNYKLFDVPYNGTDNDNYADGEGFCCNDGSMEAAMAQARKAQVRAVARSFKDPDNYENLQFFYHPDHLGSSSFITNLEGEVVQHIEYVPFGEVFIEERNNVWNTPYLFNAKEFDEETGLYYYGARYYDSRLGMWLSTDDERESMPFSSPYAYCFNNPLNSVDPDGNSPISIAIKFSSKKALIQTAKTVVKSTIKK